MTAMSRLPALSFPLRATVALVAVWLGACTTPQPYTPPRGEPGVVVPGEPAPGVTIPDATGEIPQPLPEPGPGAVVEEVPSRPIPDYPRTAEQISGAAVTALIRQARAARLAGNPDQAAAALERALRIEPRNYFVWSALGQTYLAQKNYAQAESVAQKSTVLARGNVWVELENWKTIASARQARGDAVGALQAQTRVDELTQWLMPAAPPAGR
jgi:hypothetical protein